MNKALFALSLGAALASMLMSQAAEVTVLESFEDGIDSASLSDWGDSRASASLVDLESYEREGPDDILVTDGDRSLRVTLREQAGWSADYQVTLSEESSQLVRAAAESGEEARYVIYYDVVFPETGTTVPWMNTSPHIDNVTRGQLEAGDNRQKTMVIPLDLINQDLADGEGPVTILMIHNFGIQDGADWSEGIDIHLDNIRLVDTYSPGAVPIVTVLNSFEEDDDLTRVYEFNNWDPAGRYAASLHDKEGPEDLAVTDGERSLEITYDGAGGWAPDFEIDFRGTALEEALLVPRAARTRYTLRFDVIFADTAEGSWNGDWQNIIIRTQAASATYAMTRAATGQHVRTYSLPLDSLDWPTPDPASPDDENANIIFVGQGAWEAPGMTMHFDNFRLIDTGNVPLAVRDIQLAPSGELTLSWISSETQAYNVDGSIDMQTWAPVLEGIEGAAGTDVTEVLLTQFPEGLPGQPPLADAEYYRVVVAGRAAPLREDFESGLGEWTVGAKETNTGTTEWEVGTPTSGPGAAHQGTGAAATNLAGDADSGTHIFLRSPLVDLTTFTSPPTLTFWHAIEAEGTFAARVTVLDANGNLLQGPNEGDPGFYSSSTDGWEEAGLTVNATGMKVFIEWEFIQQGTGPGWYLDGVRLAE